VVFASETQNVSNIVPIANAIMKSRSRARLAIVMQNEDDITYFEKYSSKLYFDTFFISINNGGRP